MKKQINYYMDDEDMLTDDFDDLEEAAEYYENLVKENIKKLRRGDCMEDYKMDKDVIDYDVISGDKEIITNPLENVIGHEEQKKELLNMINWFKNIDDLKSKGITIPKGVLLFGAPGNGKSFIIKELIKCIDCNTYVFKGSNCNLIDSINTLFNKASQEDKAVIIIDELDLLIDRDRRVTRALQENLDGVEKRDNILVLCATNDIHDIPDPLLRCGRLDKIISIPYLEKDESVKLLKKYFNDFNIKLVDDYLDEDLGMQLHYVSCSNIKAIVNDLVLRNGFTNLTAEMLDESINNITERVKSRKEEGNLQIAIHEAGHAVVANHFPKYFKLNKLNMNGYSGVFEVVEVEEGFWNYKKALAHIMISMAGNIAERLICQNCSLGSEDDLQKARLAAYNLINMSGFSSCWETLPRVSNHTRTETEIKKRKNEKKIEKILKKCEKETYIMVKKNIGTIKALAEALFEKKKLKSSEIVSIVG